MCNKHWMLGQTTVIHPHTHTHSHTLNTFTQAQHSVNSHEKHTHSLKRWKSGKNAGWQGRQPVIVQFNRPVSRKNRESDNLVSGIIRKKHTEKYNIYLNTYTRVCMFVFMIYWGERANQRHTHHHRSSRVCEWSLHVWQLSCMLKKMDKQKTDTGIHISEA